MPNSGLEPPELARAFEMKFILAWTSQTGGGRPPDRGRHQAGKGTSSKDEKNGRDKETSQNLPRPERGASPKPEASKVEVGTPVMISARLEDKHVEIEGSPWTLFYGTVTKLGSKPGRGNQDPGEELTEVEVLDPHFVCSIPSSLLSTLQGRAHEERDQQCAEQCAERRGGVPEGYEEIGANLHVQELTPKLAAHRRNWKGTCVGPDSHAVPYHVLSQVEKDPVNTFRKHEWGEHP